MNHNNNESLRLLAILEAQQKCIDQLVGLVGERDAQANGSEAVPATEPMNFIDWLHISGQERVNAWEALAAFVEGLVYRYGLQMEILPCWWQHSDAVEELTALWQIEKTLYRHDAGPATRMSWQDSFYKSRGRLADMFVSCRDGHIDATAGAWMSHAIQQDFHHTIREQALGTPADDDARAAGGE